LGEELRQLFVARKAFDARHGFARPAPAQKLKIERQKAGGDSGADIAQPQYADAGITRGSGQHALLPSSFTLHRVEEALTAMSNQDMHGHILRHLMHQRGIDKTHQRQMPGKIRIAQKSVHTRAQRKHRAQLRQ